MQPGLRLLKASKRAAKAIGGFLKPSFGIKRAQPRGQGKARLRSQSGQVIVEYILLLMVAVGIASLLTRRLVSRNQDSPGIITSAWHGITTAIGNDVIE